jgi:hypothetical protein
MPHSWSGTTFIRHSLAYDRLRCMKPALLTVALVLAPALAGADTSCPTTVTDAAKKAFPGATITTCKPEDGAFEVKLETKDKSKIEADFDAKGTLLQTEEVVPLASLPAAVTKAFAAKYPKAKASRAEKMTKMADKSSEYEIAFATAKGNREATFKADGTFVEEE